MSRSVPEDGMASDAPLFERVYLLGAGLIGGSMAIDLVGSGAARSVVGSDADPAALEKALELGILAEHVPFTPDEITSCDLVILAVPVLQLESLLRSGFPEGTLVTDVGSVKKPVVKAYRDSIEAGGSYRFVPGHPVAGDERSGPTAARSGLFDGARVILTQVDDNDEDIRKISSMWRMIGSQVEIMSPERHDAIFAWVSHLPHMAAYGIVDTVLRKDSSWVDFSGGGLRDYTRIAASSPAMWADIAVSNRQYLLEAVGELKDGLGRIEELIKTGSRDELLAHFQQIASVRRRVK